MPLPSIVQAPSPEWEIDVMYPSPRGDAVAPYGLLTALPENVGCNRIRDGASNESPTSSAHSSAGGGFSNLVASWGGVNPGVGIYSKGGTITWTRDMLDGLRAPIPVNPNNVFATNAELPSALRVWILSCLIRCRPNPSVGNNLTGVCIAPNIQGGNAVWPTNAVGAANKGGFGVFADGAGQWQFQSYNRAGISLLRTSQALPAHTFDQFNLAEFQIIAARAGFPATLELWWNGVLVGSWNWLGTDLELPQGNEWMWCPGVGAGPNLTMGSMFRMRRGRFTVQGVEVTG